MDEVGYATIHSAGILTEKPRRIRFSKGELERIERLTSQDARDAGRGLNRTTRSFLTRFYQCFLSVCIAIFLIGGVGFVVLRGGVDSDLLRDEAQKSLSSVLGSEATASIGNAVLSLDRNSLVAINAQDVSISDPALGIAINNIGSLRLGLSPLPLLAGKLHIAELAIDGADFQFLEQDGPAFWKTLPYDEQGLLDFDAISREIFVAMRHNLQLLGKQNPQAVELSNSTFQFKVGETVHTFHIQTLRLVENSGQISLAGNVEWGGQNISLAGTIDWKDDERNELAAFELQLRNIPVRLGSSDQVSPVLEGRHVNPAHFVFNGEADLLLAGQAATSNKAERLSVSFDVDNIGMQLGKVDDVRGQASLKFEHVVGSGKLEILPSQIQLGGLSANFNGAVGPDPDFQDKIEGPAYRFEVVTSSATSLPVDSTDPELSFGVHIGGRFLAENQRIQFTTLDLKTATGELYGQGSMGFGQGSPEMIFMLRIPTMAVSDAKHLWPIDVADGAREWVLKNLFGGTLKDSRIDISLAAGRFNGPGRPPPMTGDEIKADFNVVETRFDVVGELPPVRDVVGNISVRGAHATIKLDRGVVYTDNNRQAQVTDGTLIIPWGPQRPVIAELDLSVSGDAAAIIEIVGKKPIDIQDSIPFSPEDVTGEVNSRIMVNFAVSRGAPPGTLQWNADIDFNDLSLSRPIGGSLVSAAKGSIKVDQSLAVINADGRLDGIPATVSMTEPLLRSGKVKPQQKIKLEIDDSSRDKLFPELKGVLSGLMSVELGMKNGDKRQIQVDLRKTRVSLPWLGWQKGNGVPAKLSFDLTEKGPAEAKNFEIENLILTGDTFGARGALTISGGRLQSVDLNDVRLTRTDRLSLKMILNGGSYRATVKGTQFDARALVKQAMELNDKGSGSQTKDKSRFVVSAQIDEVTGFHGETLKNLAVSYEKVGSRVSGVSVNATTSSGKKFTATNNDQQDARSLSLQSEDAGAVLRFFDFYDKMRGGKISIGLAGQGDGPLSGQIDARNFSIVDEPRLAKIVSSSPEPGGRSLDQAVKRKIDVSRVDFERGFSFIEKGKGYLKLSRGVVRGPSVGATFQGTLYDAKGDMEITGTFMPAYGLNRMFSEVPILGALLGNGRDKGLLGITFKLIGSAKQPQVIVNPISIIAPGIFRTIFEF